MKNLIVRAAVNALLLASLPVGLARAIDARQGAAPPQPKPYVADPAGLVLKTELQTVKVEILTRDLDTPFALAFLPDGRLLISERPGRLRLFNKGVLSAPVKGTPTPHVQQDGGYLDVEIHPQYAKNGWIYLAYSEVQPGFTPPPPAPPPDPAAPPATGAPQGRGRGPQIPSMTVVVRGKINQNNEWIDQQTIFRASPALYTPSGAHFGARMVFDRQNHLFFSLGERGAIQNSQDLKTPLGKIHRMNDDGTAPKDNPFVGTPDAVPTIWSYGHRNPQGLAWDPLSGKLWSSEHGPGGGDEINVIERGHNYGWAVVTRGTQKEITKTSEPGMDDPIVFYTPSIGPTGIAFYTGDRYPKWKNRSLFLSALVGQKLIRLEIAGDTIAKQEVIFDQLGRVRDIVQAPDGYFYIATQAPTGAGTGLSLSAATAGMLIRLMPEQ
jgi:glucose/arabinose dehydrogenase